MTKRLVLVLIVCLCAIAVLAVVGVHISKAQSTDKHGINVNGPNDFQSDPTAVYFADEVAATDVQWVFLPALWAWAEPNAPTPYDPGGGWQGPSTNWHVYNLGMMHALYDELKHVKGLNVVIGMYKHPTWAGGQSCTGFSDACGIVMIDHRDTFHDGIEDFAAYLADQFPDANGFAIWNEPNLAEDFSPQPLGGGYNTPLQDYDDLIFNPAVTAIKNALPSATIVAADLFTSSNGNDGTTTDSNWGYSAWWLSGWVNYLMTHEGSRIDKVSIHNYGGVHTNQYSAANNTMYLITTLGLWPKQVWMTEMNISGNGTCDNGENTMADHICNVYRTMNWERTFYFSFYEGGSCGKALLRNLTVEKWLYTAFHSIVDGGYICN